MQAPALGQSPAIRQPLFIAAAALTLTPWISPPVALLIGFVVAQTIGNPFPRINGKATGWLLKASVVGLGLGVNVFHAMEAGKDGLLFTVFSISATLLGGWLLGRWLRVDKKTAYLVSCGTAICGGSAIAAVSPIIQADEKQISVALGTVFVLNSVALLIFPPIGHLLHLSQHQFGIWSAIAIHDTSSVVGAAAAYGNEALQVATTIKLERALWIIPVSLATAFGMKGESKKVAIPYFIGLFVIAMLIGTFLPQFKPGFDLVVLAAKKGMTLTLFLIGTSLSVAKLRSVGFQAFAQGVAVWLIVSVLAFGAAFWLG